MNSDLLRGNLDLTLLTILEQQSFYGFITTSAGAQADGYFQASNLPCTRWSRPDGLAKRPQRQTAPNSEPSSGSCDS